MSLEEIDVGISKLENRIKKYKDGFNAQQNDEKLDFALALIEANEMINHVISTMLKK